MIRFRSQFFRNPKLANVPAATKAKVTSAEWNLATLAIWSFFCGSTGWGATASIFEGFSSRIESKHFVFYSDLPRHEAQRYVEFSNLFLDVVNRDFVNLRNLKKIGAVVLADQNVMQRFLTQRLGRNEPPLYGIYIAEHHLFVTYDTVPGSGLSRTKSCIQF